MRLLVAPIKFGWYSFLATRIDALKRLLAEQQQIVAKVDVLMRWKSDSPPPKPQPPPSWTPPSTKSSPHEPKNPNGVASPFHETDTTLSG